MQTDQIVSLVSDRAGIDEDEARRTVDATVHALARSMDDEEARDAAAQLPSELATTMEAAAGQDQEWDGEAALAYVAEQLDVDGETAQARVGSVLDVLGEALTTGEFDDLMLRADLSSA